MFGDRKGEQKTAAPRAPADGASAPPITVLTVVGDRARMEGKVEIADSIEIECDVGGELNVGGRLVIGEKGTVEGNMVAIGGVEITETGRVCGNIQTDSLVISKGGFFSGNVTNMNGQPSAQRPVDRIEDKRAGQQSA